MLQYLLNNWDTIIYVLVFVVIYIILIFVWRKIASIETSVHRLDRILATLCTKHAKPEEDMKDVQQAFNEVFVATCNFKANPPMPPIPPMPPKAPVYSSASHEQRITELPDEVVDHIPQVLPNHLPDEIDNIIKEQPTAMENLQPEDIKDVDDETDSRASISRKKLQRMSVDVLRDQARSFNLSADGTKAELISRILESQNK